MGSKGKKPPQQPNAEDAAQLLEQVVQHLGDYVFTMYPNYLKSSGQPTADQQPTAPTTLSQKEKKAASKNLTAFQDSCASFLDLKEKKYFYGVVDQVLLQKSAEESIIRAFQAVLEHNPGDDNEFNFFVTVLDLMSVFFEAYARRIEKLPAAAAEELLNLPDCCEALQIAGMG